MSNYQQIYNHFIECATRGDSRLVEIAIDVDDAEKAIKNMDNCLTDDEKDKKKCDYIEIVKSAYDETEQLSMDLIDAKRIHDKGIFCLLNSSIQNASLYKVTENDGTADSLFIFCLARINDELAYIEENYHFPHIRT